MADAMAVMKSEKAWTRERIFLGALVNAYSKLVMDAKISEKASKTYDPVCDQTFMSTGEPYGGCLACFWWRVCEGCWNAYVVGVFAGVTSLVNVVLDNCRPDHGEGAEEEAESDALDGCEADAALAEGWVSSLS